MYDPMADDGFASRHGRHQHTRTTAVETRHVPSHPADPPTNVERLDHGILAHTPVSLPLRHPLNGPDAPMFDLTWLSPNQHCQRRLTPGAYVIHGPDSGLSSPELVTRDDVSHEKTRSSDLGRILVQDPWLDSPQFLLHLHLDGQVKLENLGRPVLLPNGRRINPGQSQVLTLPCQVVVGKTRIALNHSESTWKYDETLTVLRRDNSQGTKREKGMSVSPAAATLVQWFDSLNQLQASLFGSQEFYNHAVQCTFDPGGLDLGMLLQLDGDEWQIAASHVPFPEAGFSFRRALVERVRESKQLWFHMGCDDFSDESDQVAHWVVAAPIMNQHGDVVSVLYAVRFESSFNKRHGIRPLEAHYIRLVADAISAASRRIEAQAEAARAQILLEQTFSPPVVQLLQRDPQLLQSRECEITILFADLRGFSRLSQRLGASLTHQLLADILNRWTDLVLDHQGVVIDFYGDGLAAFWNCPVPVPDHAWRATQTAWEFQAALDDVNELWSQHLLAPLQAGIGINTGTAQVGNSGSQSKLKYGPRGHEVNVASRLENATKTFGVPILVSQSTAERLQPYASTLRLCRTCLPGLKDPVNVYQLLSKESTPQESGRAKLYTQSLAALEAHDFTQCLDLLLTDWLQIENDRRFEFLLRQLEIHANGEGGWTEKLQKIRSMTHGQADTKTSTLDAVLGQ